MEVLWNRQTEMWEVWSNGHCIREFHQKSYAEEYIDFQEAWSEYTENS